MISTIMRMFETIDGGDWDALRRFFDPSCVYERPGYPPITGIARLEQFYRDERRIDTGRHHLRDHFERRDGMIVTGSFDGILRDGRHVQAEFADQYRFAGRLILYRRTFFYTPLI